MSTPEPHWRTMLGYKEVLLSLIFLRSSCVSCTARHCFYARVHGFMGMPVEHEERTLISSCHTHTHILIRAKLLSLQQALPVCTSHIAEPHIHSHIIYLRLSPEMSSYNMTAHSRCRLVINVLWCIKTPSALHVAEFHSCGRKINYSLPILANCFNLSLCDISLIEALSSCWQGQMKTDTVECKRHMIVHIISPTPPAQVVIKHSNKSHVSPLTLAPALYPLVREAASLCQSCSLLSSEMCVMRSSNNH